MSGYGDAAQTLRRRRGRRFALEMRQRRQYAAAYRILHRHDNTHD